MCVCVCTCVRECVWTGGREGRRERGEGEDRRHHTLVRNVTTYLAIGAFEFDSMCL